ncbi:MAG: hypothetical protein ISS69_08385 [Phycisphaerae bacterium]|nr:hypothetical protein [Phycisphaerae bacterium]
MLTHLQTKTCQATPRVTRKLGLAAAYAEAGQFDQAIATASGALEMAIKHRQTHLLAPIRSRLKLYRQGKPYRQP